MKKLFLAMMLSLPLMAAAQYTGKVYVDDNRNGICDRGERPMKGVAVSDGLNVVLTDANGSFTLPGHEKNRFVFITTPSGYKTLNAYYQRIEGADKQYNFGLLPYNGGIARDGSHRFAHISDTEIGTVAGQEEWTANMRNYAANEHLAFIIHTGDICYPAGLRSHIKVMNSANMPETQVFYAIGNHDLVSGKYGEEMFESIYGPTFYSFEVGNVHYIVTPMYGGDYAPSYRRKDVYRWLENDLKYVPKSKAIYMFNHSIADDLETFRLPLDDGKYIDLPEHNLKAWLYGHWHVNHIYHHEKTGVRSICTATPIYGGIDHASSAWRVMHIDSRGDFTSEMRYTYVNKSMAIASIHNQQACVDANGLVPLSVNVYSAEAKVAKMTYSCTYGGKKIVTNAPLKQNTDFNWSADMQLNQVPDGQYVTVCVEAVYTNGEVSKCQQSFCCHSAPTRKVEIDKPWTNLLGNAAHTGCCHDTIADMQLAWVRNVGENIYMSSPLVSDGALYVATTDDNENGKSSVVKIDAVSGKIIWRFKTKSSIRNSIAIECGRVFAQDVSGRLYAVDAQNGSLVWEKDMKVGVTPPINDGLVTSNGVLYAGTGKQLCAYDAATGKQLWQNTGWNRGEGCTATLSLGDNGVLIGHAHWGALHANDAATGKHLWASTDGELWQRSSSPAMWGDVMYLVSMRYLFVIEARTGRVIVRKQLNYDANVSTVPLVTDKEIIFGTSSNGILALDRSTYEEKWHFKTGTAIISSAPYTGNRPATVETSALLVGNTVMMGASDGYVYAVDRTNGRLQWRHFTGAPVFATMSVSGNTVFAVDFSGNVYAFSGELKPCKKGK
ncbi:MAG: PQQ-binding-like beta-propeller repeat protein [Muribaculaceae bacterium]